jgi:vitamin B12 transporter
LISAGEREKDSNMRFLQCAATAVVVMFSIVNHTARADQALDETFITATRTPEPADRLAASTIIIDRAAIDRKTASDVGELLAQHAGLELARNGGPGQAASLFVRGANSDHTLVLVDGVRINPGTIGGAALHNIAADSIERIEIVKGPRSALWGSDAIGGVVNIFTRATAADGVNVGLAAGRYGTRALQVDGGRALGLQGRVGFSVSRNESDGFAPLTSSRDDRGFRDTSINLSADWMPNDRLGFEARGWRSTGNNEYLDFFATPVSQDFDNQALSVAARLRPGDASDYRLGLLQMVDEIQQREADDFVRTRRSTLDLQGNWRLPNNLRLTAGAMLSRENARALSFGAAYDIDTDLRQGYLQAQYDRGRHRLAIAGAVSRHPAFGSHATWNAEYGVRVFEGTRLAVTAGTAFKAPDATDRFGFGGNPNLEPESSRQFEIGLRQSLGARQSLSLTAFRNDVDDLINYVITDFVTFDGRNQNIDRARIAGIELGYRVAGETWSVNLGATFNNPRDLDSGALLLRRARRTALLSATKTLPRWELSADARWTSKRQDFGFPAPVRLAAYTLVDLGAGFAVTPQWKLQLRLDNAFDEHYELVSGYRTPGRGLTLATRYRFR